MAEVNQSETAQNQTTFEDFAELEDGDRVSVDYDSVYGGEQSFTGEVVGAVEELGYTDSNTLEFVTTTLYVEVRTDDGDTRRLEVQDTGAVELELLNGSRWQRLSTNVSVTLPESDDADEDEPEFWTPAQGAPEAGDTLSDCDHAAKFLRTLRVGDRVEFGGDEWKVVTEAESDPDAFCGVEFKALTTYSPGTKTLKASSGFRSSCVVTHSHGMGSHYNRVTLVSRVDDEPEADDEDETATCHECGETVARTVEAVREHSCDGWSVADDEDENDGELVTDGGRDGPSDMERADAFRDAKEKARNNTNTTPTGRADAFMDVAKSLPSIPLSSLTTRCVGRTVQVGGRVTLYPDSEILAEVAEELNGSYDVDEAMAYGHDDADFYVFVAEFSADDDVSREDAKTDVNADLLGSEHAPTDDRYGEVAHCDDCGRYFTESDHWKVFEFMTCPNCGTNVTRHAPESFETDADTRLRLEKSEPSCYATVQKPDADDAENSTLRLSVKPGTKVVVEVEGRDAEFTVDVD